MSSTNGAGASRSVSIEEAEALVRSLAGVAAARVLTGPQGKVMRIQVLLDDAIPPHQLVRNVQSALLARFGLLIEPGSIEFVDQMPSELPGRQEGDSGTLPPQIVAGAESGTQEPRPGPRPEPGARSRMSRPYLLDRPTIERLRPNRIRCRVEIAFGEAVTVGEAEVLDGAGAALVVTARAVLASFRTANPVNAEPVELEGVRAIELAGQSYVIAGVRAVEPRNVHYLAGAAVIESSGEEAAALATIDAVEQWISRRTLSARGTSRQ